MPSDSNLTTSITSRPDTKPRTRGHERTRGGQELTDPIVKKLPLPASGNTITYDAKARGFGIRVTAAGARSFVLNYRTRTGRERRYTIGPFPGWATKAARIEAERLKKRIRDGHDPLAEIEADRSSPTVADLAARFSKQYLQDGDIKLRPSTRRNYRQMLDKEVLPVLRHLKVAEVTHSDIDGLHHKITKRGKRYLANRVLELCRRMFSLAMRWEWRETNPAAAVERNHEEKRHRYLGDDELARLMAALAAHPDQQAADIIRILLLTGARKGEVLAMRWADVDPGAGTWTKPGHTTKQKTLHHVPLSAPARQILARLRAGAPADAVFVFPSLSSKTGHHIELKDDWAALCAVADIRGVRVHDLRHSYASQLVNAGFGLPVIGAMLGHSQPATTARYAHLYTSVLEQAAERVGALVEGAGKPVAEPVPFKRAGR